MANPINYVPLNTPFFDGSGDPDGKEMVRKLGNLSRTWAIFFASESGWVTQGLHVERVGATAITGLDPGAVPDGGVFVETDRSALYESRFVSKAQAWVFVLGRMQGLLAARPTDLGLNDAGFLYVATDALDYRWSGTAWVALDTVRGGASLTHVNRLTKVTAAGVIGEAAFADTDVVLGATNLTTDGAIPKVSTTDGTLDESAMTDDGSANIFTTARNFIAGAAAAISTAAGRLYIAVKGSTGAGVFEAAGGAADADATAAGIFQVADSHGADAELRLAIIQVLTDGATATKRGGRIKIGTKANGPAGAITFWITLDQAGNCGLGGNVTPAYPVDATGDVNASGVFRKGGTAGESTTLTYLTGTPGAGQSSKTVTFSGGIETGHT